MAAPKPRSPTLKQRRFVHELPLAPSATQAAQLAGYSPKSARVIASENLTKPAIIAAIAELQDKTERSTIATLVERKERLTTILRDDYKGPIFARDVVAASDQLNRMESVYVDKSLSLNANVDLTDLEGFSLDELKALLGATSQALPPSRKGP